MSGIETYSVGLVDDPTFADGTPMPAPCNSHPDERQHWLLSC